MSKLKYTYIAYCIAGHIAAYESLELPTTIDVTDEVCLDMYKWVTNFFSEKGAYIYCVIFCSTEGFKPDPLKSQVYKVKRGVQTTISHSVLGSQESNGDCKGQSYKHTVGATTTKLSYRVVKDIFKLFGMYALM